MMNGAHALHVRVARKKTEALDVCSYELVSNNGDVLPSFKAGAHIDVLLPNGLTRQYSLCNDPAENGRYVIAVLRTSDSRGGSKAMHQDVTEGDVLQISAPRNNFVLQEGAPHSLLLAGGIGITPLLCMAHRLVATGDSFTLHYAARSRKRAAFVDALQTGRFADRVQLHFDDEANEQRLDLAHLFQTISAATQLYVCGPAGFIDAVLTQARQNGWTEDRLHWEHFGTAAAKAVSGGSFEIKLAKSGQTISVAADQSVTQALALAGVVIPTSCEQGVCGTCLTRVLQGQPDHHDLYLTSEEQAKNDQFLPCCSRAKTPLLVLDL